MSKQAFLLSIFGLWFSSFVGLSQTTITVGSNQETSGMVPIQHTSNYSYSQQIIYQSEINKEGSITKIRFNMAGSVALTNSNSWKIYMGYTTKTKFSGSSTSTDWVPISSLTQVFSGLISTDTASGWKEIVLTTPFNYNNSSNLIIAVQDIKNGTNPGAAFNVWTADTTSRVIKKFSSATISTTTPGTGQLLNTVSYLQLDIDTAVTVPNYTVTFNTVGTPANGTLTATVNGSDIISPAEVREGRNVILTATPDAGFRIKEWKLNENVIPSYTSNTYTISNIAAAASVTVEFIAIPANEVTVTVGSSQATSSLLPIQHTTAYSYTQQIVYQSEINEEGSITKIRFNMAGGVDLSNSNMWNIYMGHTTKTKFSGTASSTDWVPVGTLSQVYTGSISTDQASGWKEIVLTTPFDYNNYNNLIIAVHETKSGSNTGAAFNVWTPDTTNRSIKKFSSSSISAASPGTGELLSIVNHLQLEFLTVVTYPVTFNTVGTPANGTLTATVDGNNIISPREVREGKNVIFTATPNAGYRVKEWKLNGSTIVGNTASTYTITNILAASDVTVEFEAIPTYVVTYSTVNAFGTIAATANGTAFNSGDAIIETSNLVFTATPNTGYRVKEWKLNDVAVTGNITNTYNYANLQAITDVKVEFEAIPTYIVTYSTVNAFGTIAATANGTAFNSGDAILEGANLVFTATPNIGYRVKEWKLNDVAVTGNVTNTYNYANLQAITDVKVEFEAIPTYIVTYSTVNAFGIIAATANGTAFNSGDAILEGANLVFTATPNSGYRVKEWKLNDVAVTGNITNTYNYTNLQAITDVIVEFEAIPTYVVTYSTVNAFGTIAATANGTAFNSGDAIMEGANLVFTATPNAGYRVKEWKLNDVAVTGNITNTYNYTNLQAITDVKVEFEVIPIQTYTLTLSVNPVGAGSVSGAGSYAQGASVAISTTPSNSNYVFLNWTNGTNTVSSTPSFNYNMPNSNTTLTANFQNISSINGYSSSNISIYPNPASKSITITLDDEYIVELFDITGRRVLLENISIGTSTIDIDDLPIGTYIVKMSNSKNTQTIKLIKS